MNERWILNILTADQIKDLIQQLTRSQLQPDTVAETAQKNHRKEAERAAHG